MCRCSNRKANKLVHDNSERISHETQKQAHDCDSYGSARRPGRRGRLRAGQDKYSLKSPSGIAFSDFRGYEDWSVVSSARTDEGAQGHRRQSDHDQGVQGRRSGQRPAFPGRLQDREAPVELQEEHGGPFVVDVPDAPTQAFLMEKDSKRFPNTGGWGYAVFNHDNRDRQDDGRRGQIRLRARMPCGGEERRTTSSTRTRSGERQ